MPILDKNPLELPADWPPELLPEALRDRIRGASALVAEKPTPLLLLNPDAPWLDRMETVSPGTVVFSPHTPWGAPGLPPGPRVALFRAMDPALDTGLALRFAGFVPVYFPLLRFRFLPPPADLPRVLEEMEMAFFTSPRGVEGVFRWLREEGLPWPSVCTVAIGPSTRKALEDRGVFRVHVPEQFSAEGLVALVEGMDVEGKRVVLFRTGGRALLPDALRARGALVRELRPYETLPYPEARLRPFEKDLLSADHWMFTSPSTVEGLASYLEHRNLPLPRRVTLWAIGPATRQALERRGWPFLESPVHTPEGLVETLAAHLKPGGA